MLVYAGIDEAGYGPLLGPLCVGCAVFTVDDARPADGAPDLWTQLEDAVCRTGRDRRNRVPVDDSKRLKLPNSSAKSHPLSHLEHGVLAFMGAGDPPPEDDEQLFGRLGVQVSSQPWYGTRTPLPLAVPAGRLGISAARLRRCLAQRGVQAPLLRAEAIDAETFNRELDRLGRKSTINLGAVVRHVDAVWRRWPHAHPRVIVDRQGGRTHYREELQMTFPGSSIRVLAEGEDLSRYRLERDGSPITITFARTAEDRHFPVALASMVAKNVRELMMLRLNRFFTGRIETLRPTAGYVQDGRRYVAEIEPVMTELSIRRDALIRRA